MIRLENVSFSYRDQGPSVQDISFHVEKGEFAAIIGTNGAGKTTTVRLIDGLLRPDSGRIMISGADTAVSSVSERAAMWTLISVCTRSISALSSSAILRSSCKYCTRSTISL